MTEYDIIIIGSGPGGYTAAAAAVKAGLKTLVVEADRLGGTCLNRGCIPTKTFCRSAVAALEVKGAPAFGVEVAQGKADGEFGIGIADPQPVVSLQKIFDRKDAIVEELREGVAGIIRGADVCQGTARFTGPHTVEAAGMEYTAPYIVIATGAAPALPDIPGADLCLDSDSLLCCADSVPSMAIIGGGVIGMEFASVFNAFGCEVHVLEYCPEILPGIDREVAKRLRSVLSRRGVKFHLQARVTGVEKLPDAMEEHRLYPQLQVAFSAKGKDDSVTCARVLMAVGRRPVIPAGAEEAGVKVVAGKIETDAGFRTAAEGVYAIGDVNGRCMLAHAAAAQARAAVADIIRRRGGHAPQVQLEPVPACVFTVPELAVTGLSEEQAKERGIDFRVLKLPVRANGKALTMGATDGLVKVLVTPGNNSGNGAEKSTDSPAESRVIGAAILGPDASSLIMELSLAISAGLPVEALTGAIHPHPTLSELIPCTLE